MPGPINAVSTTSAAGTSANTTPVLPQKTLGQSDFLKLLVAQMTSQDPMNPQTNTDFVAQMAQFSALQASQTMEGDLSTLNSQQQFTQAATLLGRTVQVQTGTNTTAQGVVSGVQMVGGTPQLVIGGQLYDLSQVLSVTPTTASP
jgi:flagellar basal-body rod modification protein FlgD